jgi:hypothetical protein
MVSSTLERKTGYLPFFASLAVLLLAGCDSGSTFSGDPGAGGGGTGGGGTGGGGGGTNPGDSVQLGSTTLGVFTNGTLALGTMSLSAGGSTSVTANLVDGSGSPYLSSVSVEFSSSCAAMGQATLDSPVVTSTGMAVATYTATGCSGGDTITATAVPGSTVLSASSTVTVQPAVIGSLQFDSADPTDIGIRGFGLTESSAVQFRVLDTQGNPAAGADVSFALNTTIGGISIAPSTATSDANGYVTTFVTSGTVATSVRVTATLVANSAISTQSDSLVISTGIADQNSFSLSASELNPEAWDIDNQQVNILILAADHFNNPVPDGTAIFFTVEGGQVDSSCLTDEGQCSVTWRSSAPRPMDGRVTLLATAIGEESFTDLNGNNVLDDTDNYSDRAEAFRDDNENGVHDVGTEEFRDFNSNNIHDPADNQFNGALCNAANVTNVCSASKNIFVEDSLVLTMSGSTAFIDIRDSSNPLTSNQLAAITAGIPAYLYVFDVNGQPMPAGTTISLSTDNGSISTGTNFTVPSTNVPITSPSSSLIYPISIAPDNQLGTTGTLTIDIRTPGGTATSYFFTVND